MSVASLLEPIATRPGRGAAIPRRVIVPAAGKAVRFGGIPKELLPIGDMQSSLHHAVALARRIGEPVVITNREKSALHSRLQNVELKMQGRTPELWGAIRSGLRRGTPGALIMADTVTDFGDVSFDAPIMFGTFRTEVPHRFSIVDSGRIVTKQRAPGPREAWGVIVWNERVTDFLLRLRVEHYDRAFEAAMQRFGYGTFPLHYYHDLGTFEAYCRFLRERA